MGFMYRDKFTSKCASFPDLISSPAGVDENTFPTFCVVERLSFIKCAALSKRFQTLVLINITRTDFCTAKHHLFHVIYVYSLILE